MGTPAWARRRPGDPAEFGGPAANRTWIPISGAASPGSAGIDFFRVEGFGNESPGEILQAD